MMEPLCLDFLIYNIEGGFAGIYKTYYIDGKTKSISEYSDRLTIDDIGKINPDTTKTISSDEWTEFIRVISEIDFFSWQSRYKKSGVADSMIWMLHLKAKDRELKSSGTFEAASPEDWEKFDRILNSIKG